MRDENVYQTVIVQCARVKRGRGQRKNRRLKNGPQKAYFRMGFDRTQHTSITSKLITLAAVAKLA
jgi:hypothetical protein